MNNTSEKLIQISMRIFSEMGYYGTSLNIIANELGIKKASLYNYFKSKDELYEQCIERCMNKGMKLIKSIDTQAHNAHEELIKFFQEYI
ncbi:TetR/AcrR family transcriptional regulator [Mammaliicoccus sciuri]|uniref:TetR/AcrR family transcriptional regulator n=1 Tax=Mammaliicoccus sciuri TaxID=1296 RepID=UPI002DBF769A|nr:TetR/AcrR family transcriptional regulator [Mammaliicoccus sciuri]MEB5760139.1 TetR/AcrR family transcriptional regulator [Mammaliicoccus sciuri]